MKKIWVTSLAHDEKNIKSLVSALQPYRLPVAGHFWQDDLKQMAWADAKDELVSKEVSLWIIIIDPSNWEKLSVRQGLAALTLMVKALKANGLAILILTTDAMNQEFNLPTPLAGAKILPFTTAGLAVKITALLNLPVVKPEMDYYFNFYPLRELGLWLEIGPRKDIWAGVMLGANGAEINFQAAGVRGSLPERSTLEYAQQGLQLKLNETEFTAWAIKNQINQNSSYFARLDTLPEQLVFGSYADQDSAEVYILKFV